MSAKTTGLFFDRHPDGAEAAKHAAQMLRAKGYAVTERTGNHISTNAPYKVAIEIKRRAWTAVSEAKECVRAARPAAPPMRNRLVPVGAPAPARAKQQLEPPPHDDNDHPF